MDTLKQKYFLSSKKFELTNDRILVREKSVFDEKEWEARYNEIGIDLIKVKSREGIGNAVLFGGLLIVTSYMTFKAFTDGTDIKLAFLFLFFCFMWLTVFWWSIQKYFASLFILQGGNKTLTFFINSPKEKEVREFIEKVREKVRSRLKKDLTVFDPDLDFEDQLANLRYLKNIDVLNEKEFEFVREHLREKHLIK